MVSNINLAGTEFEKKPSLSGKSSLVISVALLVLAVVIYAFLSIYNNSLSSRKNNLESQIQQEKMKTQGPAYVKLADFQERLMLIKKIIGGYSYPEPYLRNFSQFVSPEVHLTSFSWKNDGQTMTISGIAPNFDSLSKEVILLKTDPEIDSLEFKQANEAAGAANSIPGVQFGIDAKLVPTALNQANQ